LAMDGRLSGMMQDMHLPETEENFTAGGSYVITRGDIEERN
jgi:hypothetical protein